MDGLIQLEKHEYESLLSDRALLGSLYGAGVDNWDGYDFAMELFREDYPEYAGE